MRNRKCIVCVIVSLLLSAPVFAGNIANEVNLLILYPSIQMAIDAAGNGDVIRIEADTYVENLITSNKNLTFRGGYDSTLQTDVGGYTAVDGGGVASTWIFWGSSSHVENINIVGGNAIWGGGVFLQVGTWIEFLDSSICSNVSIWGGGGLYVDPFSYAKMTGASMIFTNMAINVGAGALGGGAFVQGRLDIVHEDADVFDNTVIAGHGGGIWLEGGYLRLFQADVFRNITTTNGLLNHTYGGGIGANFSFLEVGDMAEIFENTAGGYLSTGAAHGGGGGLAMNLSTAVLGHTWGYDLTFSNNIAEYGGGIYATNSVIESQSIILSGNQALWYGGGVFLENVNSDWVDCLISGNQANDDGGGLYLYSSYTRLNDDHILNNLAGNRGGGIYSEEGTFFLYTSASRPAYTSSNGWTTLLQDNVASNSGGGLYINYPDLAILGHCAIISNSAPAYASGIHMPNGTIKLDNVLLAENTDGSAGNLSIGANGTATVDKCTFYNSSGSLRLYGNSMLSMSNSILWGESISTNTGVTVVSISFSDVGGGWVGPGNINTNPSLYDNYHLRYDSPCIGAGVFNDGTYDIDFENRQGDMDMGVDEFIDDDGDHLPSIVETGTGIWNGDSDMGTDPYNPESDGDNVSDYEEWIADTDPTDPAKFLGMRRMWNAGGIMGIMVEWRGGSNANQVLEYNTNLTSGTWNTHSSYSAPTAVSNSANVYYDKDVYHYRIRAYR